MEIGMGMPLRQTKQDQAMKSLQQTKSTKKQEKKRSQDQRDRKKRTKRPPVENDKSKRNQKARDNGQQYCILIANGSRPETSPFPQFFFTIFPLTPGKSN